MTATHGDDKDQIFDKHGKPFPLSNLYNAQLKDAKRRLKDVRKIFIVTACRGTDKLNHDGEYEIPSEPKVGNTVIIYSAISEKVHWANVFPNVLNKIFTGNDEWYDFLKKLNSVKDR